MTGFARVRRPLGDGELVVSLKSLNHRGLDVQVHAPSAADAFENAIRTLIKGSVVRGHVEVRVSLPQSATNGSATVLNHALLEEYLKSFREAAEVHGLDSRPDLNAALRLPGMFGEAGEAEPAPDAGPLLMEALEHALRELNAFRGREGGEIAAEMSAHNTRVAAAAEQMERIRSGASAAF